MAERERIEKALADFKKCPSCGEKMQRITPQSLEGIYTYCKKCGSTGGITKAPNGKLCMYWTHGAQTEREEARGLYLTDSTLKELVQDLREELTPEEAIDIMASIADETPDFTEVPEIYRIAHTVKEAYIRGFIRALDIYREAVKATLDGIDLEEEREVTT